MTYSNTNPAGNPVVRGAVSTPVHRPTADVISRQDPRHSERDFLRDLDKATQRKPKAS